MRIDLRNQAGRRRALRCRRHRQGQVTAVKERELPEADDEFAQLASEFDTIDELKEDLKQASESAVVEQGIEARDKVLDKLVGSSRFRFPRRSSRIS